MNCKFLRPAHYDDLLTIKTILKELPTDHKMEFNHEVYNEQGKLLTIAKVVLYFMNAVTMEKTKMPETWNMQLAAYFK
jgi:acyl-CoA thioester hydrolase